MAEVLYDKKCVYCETPYQSPSRNKRYCSDECCAKAQVKRKSINKARKRRKKEYDQNAEAMRLTSAAYRVTHLIMDYLGIPEECTCDLEHECEGPLERHHKDGNVLNNSPWNLMYTCRKGHELMQATLHEVNLPLTLTSVRESTEDPEERVNVLRNILCP